MPGGIPEVLVSSEQHHLVSNAKLGKQCINGADLYSSPAACVAQSRRVDMVIPVRMEQRHRCKSLYNLSLRFWTMETLQKLLQNQPGSDDHLGT